MNWIWVLIPLTALSIPIIAIISSVIEKYIKAQEGQASVIAEELMVEINSLKATVKTQREHYDQRIENLEALASANAEPNQQTRALPAADERVPMPDFAETENAKKVALLAEQLKG